MLTHGWKNSLLEECWLECSIWKSRYVFGWVEKWHEIPMWCTCDVHVVALVMYIWFAWDMHLIAISQSSNFTSALENVMNTRLAMLPNVFTPTHPTDLITILSMGDKKCSSPQRMLKIDNKCDMKAPNQVCKTWRWHGMASVQTNS